MYKFLFIVFLFIIFQVNTFAQNVTLYGVAPSYVGEKLTFYTYSDLITYTEEELGNCVVDSLGKFECKINLNSTKQAFIDVGIFHCIFYVEPQKDLKINLPEKIDKELKDYLNPYFEPVYFFVGMNDTLDLNYKIKTFDDVYDDYMASKFLNMYSKPNRGDVEFFIHRTEGRFLDSTNTYFNTYKKYRYARIKNLSYIMDYQRMTLDYFHDKPIFYNNPAYMELFNSQFENFFGKYSVTGKGKDLINNIELEKSVHAIKQTLKKHIEFSNDTLEELIILKGLFDAFFIRNMIQYPVFHEVQLNHVLDSMEILTKIPEHKIIAKNIRAKIRFLARGTKAPEFELQNEKGERVSLKSFEGKYVYLNFCNTNSRECREDFELIKEIAKKYKQLEIVSIATDEDFGKAKAYFEKMKYKWTLLDFKSQKEIIKQYNVQLFPTYYLIDKQGLFMLSPGISPKENIEQLFWRIYKEKELYTPKEYDDLFRDPRQLK